jgi:Protein of unknown function (DUF2917)
MRARPNFVLIAFKARSVRRIANGLGLKVTCLRGQVWLTQSNDPRDIILTSGNSFVLDRPGIAVVFAFTDALTQVGEPELVAGANENTPAGASRSAA